MKEPLEMTLQTCKLSITLSQMSAPTSGSTGFAGDLKTPSHLTKARTQNCGSEMTPNSPERFQHFLTLISEGELCVPWFVEDAYKNKKTQNISLGGRV